MYNYESSTYFVGRCYLYRKIPKVKEIELKDELFFDYTGLKFLCVLILRFWVVIP
jgi:hypothetical protein